MSWVEQIKTDFVITCGDGTRWFPLWTYGVKSKEYNLVEYEFPKLEGTLALRGTPKGRRYPLEFQFQGEDHLDVAKAFEKSADDPRPWVVTHPFYGIITVQPASLSVDNTGLNVSKFVASVIETIVTGGPKFTEDPIDKISFDKVNLDETIVNGFDVTPSVKDVNRLSANNASSYKAGAKKVPSINAEAYFNSFNAANTAIANATASPLAAIRTGQAVINAPSQFQMSVKARLTLLVSQFATLVLSAKGSTTRASKKIFESNGSTLVSSLATTVATPLPDDFGDRVSVLEAIETVIDTYNTFIKTLDDLQSYNGGSPDSYIPDPYMIGGLGELINFALSNLFTIAMGAKQERSLVLDADSNIINICHKVYRLQPDDSTLEKFIEINKIGINEMLVLAKGRKIIYYV